MRIYVSLLVLVLLAAFSPAAHAQSCLDTYNECNANCCSACGGTVTSGNGGQNFCEGPEGARQQCVDACLQCSHDYGACVSTTAQASGAGSGSGRGSTSGSGCCGSAAVLGSILGVSFLRGRAS